MSAGDHESSNPLPESARQVNELLRRKGLKADYRPDTIVNPWNHPGIMLHEGGHIANHRDHTNLLNLIVKDRNKADVMANGIHGYARNVMPFYSQASGVGLAALAPKEMGRHAWLLPLLGSAPLVGEEALASIRGVNELRKQRGMGAALAATPALMKALSTYMAMPAGMSLAAYLINRWKKDPQDTDSKIRRDKRKARVRNKKRRDESELRELTVQSKAAGFGALLKPLAKGFIKKAPGIAKGVGKELAGSVVEGVAGSVTDHALSSLSSRSATTAPPTAPPGSNPYPSPPTPPLDSSQPSSATESQPVQQNGLVKNFLWDNDMTVGRNLIGHVGNAAMLVPGVGWAAKAGITGTLMAGDAMGFGQKTAYSLRELDKAW